MWDLVAPYTPVQTRYLPICVWEWVYAHYSGVYSIDKWRPGSVLLYRSIPTEVCNLRHSLHLNLFKIRPNFMRQERLRKPKSHRNAFEQQSATLASQPVFVCVRESGGHWRSFLGTYHRGHLVWLQRSILGINPCKSPPAILLRSGFSCCCVHHTLTLDKLI